GRLLAPPEVEPRGLHGPRREVRLRARARTGDLRRTHPGALRALQAVRRGRPRARRRPARDADAPGARGAPAPRVWRVLSRALAPEGDHPGGPPTRVP